MWVKSPAFRVRCGDATFDLGRFLDEKGILILDGSSRGNLSRDAASVMMGAIILKVIQHCRTESKSRVVLVIDEAVSADLIGVYESQALSEAGKWGLEFHILIQDPFAFSSEEIRGNVLQNCWRHEWFRQGSPEAARLAAEDIATPLLDPLKPHHTEYRTRTLRTGYERVQVESSSAWHDPSGKWTRGRARTWSTVLWPLWREIRDAQDRYTALTDQILLIQKELMLLRAGYRFVRYVKITATPEYVPLLKAPGPAGGDSVPEAKVRAILAVMKRPPLFRPPMVVSPSERSSSPGAARKIAGQGRRYGIRHGCRFGEKPQVEEG